jgi:hypothetical protein
VLGVPIQVFSPSASASLGFLVLPLGQKKMSTGLIIQAWHVEMQQIYQKLEARQMWRLKESL